MISILHIYDDLCIPWLADKLASSSFLPVPFEIVHPYVSKNKYIDMQW